MFHDKNPTKVANNVKNCGSHVRLHNLDNDTIDPP